jgi:sigma-B regulation protein RsbU (phosphoserine phosphatase)
MEAGADDFIHKPIQMDELLARIRAGERVLQLEKSLQDRNVKLQELSDNLLAAQKIITWDLQLAGTMQRSLLPTASSSLQGVAIDCLFFVLLFMFRAIFLIFPAWTRITSVFMLSMYPGTALPLRCCPPGLASC